LRDRLAEIGGVCLCGGGKRGIIQSVYLTFGEDLFLRDVG